MIRSSLLTVSLFATLIATDASGQSLALRRQHPGALVFEVGDIDGDGTTDYAQRVTSLIAPSAGGVRAFSGASGQVLFEIQSGVTGADLGRNIWPVGDLNGDGTADVGASVNPNGISFFAGGGLPNHLNTVLSSQPNSESGYQFRGTGDLNGDGLGEVLVATFLQPPASLTQVNFVQVITGLSGTVLRTYMGNAPGDGFGRDLAVGDFDGDQVPDLAIGSGMNFVEVRSGATGSILHHLVGPLGFGRALEVLGDVDDDGADDLAVGAPYSELVQIISGATGTVLRTLTPPAGAGSFGWHVAGIGDVNGDGSPDVAVGRFLAGPVDVFAASTGTLLLTLTGTEFSGGAPLTGDVGRLDDVNGDGFDDFIVGVLDGSTHTPRGFVVSAMAVTRLEVYTGPTLVFDWNPGAPHAAYDGSLHLRDHLFYTVGLGVLVVSGATIPPAYVSGGGQPILVDLSPTNAFAISLPPLVPGGLDLPLNVKVPSLAGREFFFQWGGFTTNGGTLATSPVIGALLGR